jgi:hypothetical protein
LDQATEALLPRDYGLTRDTPTVGSLVRRTKKIHNTDTFDDNLTRRQHQRYRLDRAASVKMKLNVSYPANGSQKIIEIDDERKLRPFMEKRMGTEVSTPLPFIIPRLSEDKSMITKHAHDYENDSLIGIYLSGCR